MKICVKLGLCLLLICANAKVVQAQDVNTTASEKAKMMEKGELKT